MTSMDDKLVNEAKNSFFDKYGIEIHNLGYSLAAGVMSIGDSLGIMAMIQDPFERGIEHDIMKKIGEIIPERYTFQEIEIPVAVRYSEHIFKL